MLGPNKPVDLHLYKPNLHRSYLCVNIEDLSLVLGTRYFKASAETYGKRQKPSPRWSEPIDPVVLHFYNFYKLSI